MKKSYDWYKKKEAEEGQWQTEQIKVLTELVFQASYSTWVGWQRGGLYALGLSQEDGHLCAVDQIHAYMLHLHAGNLLPPPHPSSPQTPPFFLLHFIFV